MQQPNLSEQDLLSDMLETEKSLISSYSTYISESSCQNLRRVLSTQFTQAAEDQYEIFDQMRKKGYYQTKDAQDADVQQAKQKFGQMKTEIS